MEMAIELVLIVILSVFIWTFLPTFFTGAPFAPTKQSGIKAMVALAAIKSGERALDIGSGDGRLVIGLAEAGANASGIEINPFLVLWSRLRIPKNLRSRVTIIRESIWHHDCSGYTALTIFGIPYIMRRLEEKLLRELPTGARIVVNRYPFPNWKPTQQQGKLYLYVKA